MQGLHITNKNNQVLVTDSTPVLHFAGIATYESKVIAASSFPHTNDPIISSVRYTFSISLPAGTYPTCFIKPADTSKLYGILNIFSSNNLWYINVIQSDHRYTTPPTLYVFTVLPNLGYSTTGNYGIMVMDSNGNPIYDTRKLPLSILDVVNQAPPIIPCNGGTPTDSTRNSKWAFTSWAWVMDFDFNSDNVYNVTDTTANIPDNAVMFHATATAQAVYSRYKYGWFFCDGGALQDAQLHERKVRWYTMYQQGFRVSNSKVYSGWMPIAVSTYLYEFIEDDKNLGTAIGAKSYGTTVHGSMPYREKTINYSIADSITISDSRMYD